MLKKQIISIFRTRRWILALGLSLLAGCTYRKEIVITPMHPVGINESTKPSSAVHYHYPKGYRPPAVVAIFQIRLPIGTFSDNKKIWKILRPLVGSPDAMALLHANGIRAGQAKIPAWHGIYKLIHHVSGATTSTSYCQTSGLAKLLVTVRKNIRRELILYHTFGGRAVLRSYHNCDNLFVLAMHIDLKSKSTVVELQPAVNVGTVSFRRGPQAMGLTGGTHPDLRSFAHLQIRTEIPPGKFLVLCPWHARRDPFSLGAQFLSDTTHIPPRQTVLIMVPMAR
jgi:hypothetical protein